MNRPFEQLGQPRDIIRQFTPNWFTVTMGTGVVALILPELSSGSINLWLGGAFLWQINIILFISFSLLYSLRWLFYPTEARQIFFHSNMSLFLGAIPMGLATIVNGFLKYGLPLYGDSVLEIAKLLWYIDVVMAVGIAWLIPFCMFSCQQHQLHSMTAIWLLPIVACEVAANSGGVLIQYLAISQQTVAILMASYGLWGISVLPAFAILTILMLRLALHQLPSKDMAISSWLALGPIGTGALALLSLGSQAPCILTFIGQKDLGMFLQYAGTASSLILLGFGLWWLGLAVLTTLKYIKRGLPFNLGWWGLTFPLGVFTLAIYTLGQQLQLSILHNIASSLTYILIILWVVVATKTVQGFYRGNLLFSPCLKSFLDQG